MSRRYRRLDAVAVTHLDGATVSWEDARRAPDGTEHLTLRHETLTIPASMGPAECPGCGSTAPGTEAPDFDCLPGCTIAEELAGETAADLAELHRLRDAREPTRIERDTTGAEADLWQARGVTATADRVVVDLNLDGTRARWWPRVQR